jgi:hypothetical protein
MPVMVIGDFRAKPESERDVERAFGERLIRREGELAGLRRRAGWAPPSAMGGGKSTSNSAFSIGKAIVARN